MYMISCTILVATEIQRARGKKDAKKRNKTQGRARPLVLPGHVRLHT